MFRRLRSRRGCARGWSRPSCCAGPASTPALPPGTLAVVFSPLHDARALTVVTDLRRRGFPVIVLGTLRDEPPGEPPQATARLARRLWLLDRAATRMALAGLGVLVGAAAPDLTACSPRSASRHRHPPPGGPVMSRRPVPLLGSLRLAHPGRIDRRGRRLPHRPAVLAARQVTGRHQLCSRSPGTGEGGVSSNTLAAVR